MSRQCISYCYLHLYCCETYSFITNCRYDFSFLSERCHPVIKEDHVTNIYRMMVDIAHPSLYYIGLYKLGSPFREFCVQADLAAALIAEKIPTPSREVRFQHLMGLSVCACVRVCVCMCVCACVCLYTYNTLTRCDVVVIKLTCTIIAQVPKSINFKYYQLKS